MAGFSIRELDIPGARQSQARPLPSAIVVVTIDRLPEGDAEWSTYVAAYTAMFAKHRNIVLVFDTRSISMPSFHLIMRKRALMAQLKPYTVAIVSKVIILTAHALLRDLVAAVLKAGGQTAPFHIATDPAEVLHHALRMARILQGAPVHAGGGGTAQACTRASVGDAAVCSLVFIWFLLIGKHYMAQAVARGIEN